MRRLIPVLFLLYPSVAFSQDAEQFFETRIRPVLIEKCFKCHGGETDSNGLRVDSRNALLKGGDSGPAFKPGETDGSLILKAISFDDEDLQMPPDKRLPDHVIADFRRWIETGAVWPATTNSTGFKSDRHWAFQPISSPTPPDVADAPEVSMPVDAFVLKRLEGAKLMFSPRASRATLIRRLKMNLLGLPPNYEEVQRFKSDAAPDAWARLVETYLASPAYGERWGRHWLDVARYADTRGYVFTAERKYPFSHTYRDWVIRSLNEDLSYDDFLIRQIAADRLTDTGLPKSELAAMGFLTLGRRFLNNRHDIIDDRIDVISRGTMGLTVTCARCHDHKYDPIPQADYYSLYGVFASSHEPKELPGAMVLLDNANPFNPYVFQRGQPGNRGPNVPRQFLEVVAGSERQPFKDGSGRLELARAIASPDNPLTARVIVNRVWQHHFHAPLVSTPSDFGLRCDPPTHPQLLDWLASRLIDSGWSLKTLHREILLSTTYQQSSVDNPRRRAVDPENRLLWRMNRGRLELEPMRDAILAVAGDLDATMGGPSIEITKHPTPRRRTVYGFIDRQNLPALFKTFDFALPDTHSPGRFQTSVPQQTLFLRNSAFLREEARRLAARFGSDSTSLQVRGLFRRVLSRAPSADEVTMGEVFLETFGSEQPIASGWTYGYGRFNRDTGRLENFRPLPHFDGRIWMGGPKRPDARLGWVSLQANGGHPGNPSHATVLRWTAPRTMRVRIAGTLRHGERRGDGVEAIVLASGLSTPARWTAHNGRTGTYTEPFEITAGDSIDLIVDCRANESFDSYNWDPRVRLAENSSVEWNAVTQFHGPVSEPLSGLAMLAQVLLLSNEFHFVD